MPWLAGAWGTEDMTLRVLRICDPSTALWICPEVCAVVRFRRTEVRDRGRYEIGRGGLSGDA